MVLILREKMTNGAILSLRGST